MYFSLYSLWTQGYLQPRNQASKDKAFHIGCRQQNAAMVSPQACSTTSKKPSLKKNELQYTLAIRVLSQVPGFLNSLL